MKKRLLSAALAFAMVLTLIPVTAVPAFAAEEVGSDVNPTTSTTVTRQGGDAPDGRVTGNWYWSETTSKPGTTVYHKVTGGVVSGTSGSGTWYDTTNTSSAAYIYNTNGTLKTTSFTILDNSFTLDCSSTNTTSLTVNLNGKQLQLSAIDKLSSLNVSDPWSTYANRGTVSGITKTTKNSTSTPVSSLNITASNVNLGAVNLQNGVTNTLTLNGGVTISTLDMDGSNPVNGSTTYAKQNITTSVNYANEITGAVNITSSDANMTLQNITGSNGAATGAVNVTATGGTITVSGQSNFGAITVKSTATTATNTAIPSVTVNGGTVAGITHDSTDPSTASTTITADGSGTIVGSTGISVKAGTVNIRNGATVQGNVTVPTGALNITGSAGGTTVQGNIILNESGKTSFTVTGSKVTTGNISLGNNNISNLTITIPDDQNNTFGTLTLGNYNGGGIAGGVFGTAASNLTQRGWFGSNVKFMVNWGSGKWAYFNNDELSQAIASIPNSADTAGNIVVVGHGTGVNLALKNGVKTAIVSFDNAYPDAFKLPDVLLGDKIVVWTDKDTSIPVENWLFSTVAGATTLVGQDAPVQLGASSLKAVTVQSSTTGGYTSSIRARLVGNVITLTGAVDKLGGYTSIPLKLTTDAVKENGDPVEAEVTVLYDNNNKTATFAMTGWSALTNVGIVPTSTSLSMNNGKNVYTLNVSGLGLPAGNLNTAYNIAADVQVTVNKSGWNNVQKQALINKMTSSTFTWNNVPAMLEAVNAAQLTINNPTTVNNWITQAQNTVWRYGDWPGTANFKGKAPSSGNINPHTTATPTDTQRATTFGTPGKYNTLWLMPYLQVTISDVNENTGYMVATLTPSYRLVVSGPNESDLNTYYYIVQDGRSLGAITGDFGTGVKVKFDGTGWNSTFSSAYMHQDGAYVYQASTKEWTITHGSNNGLGSVVINTTPGVIELKPEGTSASPKLMYDSLQAAVDDTKPRDKDKEDVIVVGAGYGGNGALTMSGRARIIKVNVEGNTIISSAASGDLVRVTGAGHDWTVQLLKDTNVATKGNITISSATGGSASVNANPAATGQTVTITLSPNAGYTSSGVTVKTASGQTVSVSGSGNTYTFVMPSGSVTVTPSFTATSTPRKATVSVSPNSMGNTTTTAAATNNQVDAGSNVGVTTNPASGYRTMGVNVSTNGGAATAVRQGDNYFTFTVPANATAVTVTPIYDRDNGTKFSDVWSTEYYSKSVAWAVGRAVTDGTSTYTFSPSNTCTRAQMMTFLWRAAGRPSVSGANNPFVDVYPGMGSDYYSAILWAVSKGITNGVDSTHFGPSQTVSRAQAVTFLYRYAGSPSASTNTGFYDAPSSEYYARAVSWANAKGITNGTSTNYFSPSRGVSRAQAVTFLYRHITGDIA